MLRFTARKFVTGLGATAASFIAAGAILDAVSNAIQQINWLFTIVGTSLLISIWISLRLILNTYPVAWRTARITRLGYYPACAFVGVGLLIWTPHLLRLFSAASKSQVPSAAEVIVNTKEAKRFIILVADFESLDGKNYGITENLVLKLKEATQDSPDIAIQTLDETIRAKPGSTHAQLKGKERNAALVLWGWNLNYHVTACFEVLKKPKFLNLRRSSEQVSGLSMNESFDLQTQVANYMNHLVLLTIGLARLELKDYDGAITLLSRAILHKAPDQMVAPWSAYFYRGAAQYYRHKYDEAVSDFNRVINLNPEKIDGYINRALVLRLKGNSKSAASDTKKAVQFLNKRIEQNTNDAQAYLLRAIVYTNALDYPNAISDFNKSLEIHPNDFAALTYRASVFEEIADYDHVISDWTTIVALEPNYAPAYIRRGMALGRKNDLNRALADFNSALTLNPERDDLAEALVGRGTFTVY